MQKEIPKPFLQIDGKTILEWSLHPFLQLEGLQQIVVPTSEDYVEKVQHLLQTVAPESINTLALTGGTNRQHSIFKALKKVENVDLVLIHDAVRPFVDIELINSCCQRAEQVGAAILGVPAKNTIKRVNKNQEILETPSRSDLWLAQTPQAFRNNLVQKAYNAAFKDGFIGTDDASLVERLGYTVEVVMGSQHNFKITYPLDLTIAEKIIEQRKA
jgi:2-C-methyl-D-erythritol 4-phosphate cytidylyltransferase